MAKKKFKDLKKSKDVYFRKRAEKESLSPITDLNTEIRSKTKPNKYKTQYIEQAKSEIKKIEKKNNQIRYNRRKLKEEYPFTDDERKQEIDKQLNSPDLQLQTEKLQFAKNNLNYLEGKPFNFIVDDGFEKYTINSDELKKYWSKGKDASLPILERMKVNAEKAISFYNKVIKEKEKTATKAEMKKLKRIRDGLQNKLDFTIKKNIEFLTTGDKKVLDEVSDKGEKAYSMLFKVVGFSIDRIGI